MRTLRLALTSGAQRRTFSGRSQAGTTSNLSFKVSGQLKALKVKNGDAVKKGQLIAVIDDRDLRLQLRQAQAAYAQANAQARNAAANFQRMRKLYANRSVSIKDLDGARAAADSSKASVAAQGQAVALVRQQIGYCKLRAPLDGQIASVPVNVNENIKAGQPVATLNAGARLEVRFNVPESLISRVKKGTPATVHFAALKGSAFKATISEVGAAAAGGTAFPVVVQLVEARPEVRAGMAAEVTLRFGGADTKKNGKLYLPAHVVLEDRQGRFTFVAAQVQGDQATVERRAIKTGKLGPRGIAVDSGLKAGDFVLTAGLRFVEPGMKVRILKK